MFADFNRIVICTNKTNVQDARKYLEYILGVIKGKTLFGTIEIEPTTFWEHLVWMDQANFGGVEEIDLDNLDMGAKRGRKRRTKKAIRDTSDDEHGGDGSDSEVDAPTPRHSSILASDPTGSMSLQLPVEMHWNIQDYLPRV